MSKWYNRTAKLINKDGEVLLTIRMNIFHPDCFKWEKLLDKGWKVLVS